MGESRSGENTHDILCVYTRLCISALSIEYYKYRLFLMFTTVVSTPVPPVIFIVWWRFIASSASSCRAFRRLFAVSSHFSRSPLIRFWRAFVANSSFRWCSSNSFSCAFVTFGLCPPALAVNTTVWLRPQAAMRECRPTSVSMMLGARWVSAPV